MARASGSALRLRALSRAVRLRPSSLHSFEQYRRLRVGATNPLPHSLRSRRVFRAISLSALAVHLLQ